jgi:hypothetical protein
VTVPLDDDGAELEAICVPEQHWSPITNANKHANKNLPPRLPSSAQHWLQAIVSFQTYQGQVKEHTTAFSCALQTMRGLKSVQGVSSHALVTLVKKRDGEDGDAEWLGD